MCLPPPTVTVCGTALHYHIDPETIRVEVICLYAEVKLTQKKRESEYTLYKIITEDNI